MAEKSETSEDGAEDAPPAKSKKGLLIIGVVGLLAGGGAFGAVWSGALDSFLPGAVNDAASDAPPDDAEAELPDAGEIAADPAMAFHTLDPVSVSIGAGGDSRHVRLGAVLEVPPAELDSVIQISPRLQDGILGYLRAVEPEMLEDPTALLHIRSQLLRRARLIAGNEAVSNLLVTDFVLD